MASLITLMESFDVNSEEFEAFVDDLMLNNNDIPFDSQEIHTIHDIIIASINSRINHINTRYNGLLILDRMLPRCSKDILFKYSILWITKTTQMLENVHSSPQDLTLACKVLGFLIEQCKDIPELHKQISMQNVKQLINILNNLQTDVRCGAVYYLIAVLLYHYPEVCERFQGILRKIILVQIDSVQESLVNASAKCYVLLSKTIERSFQAPVAKSMYTGYTYNEALLCNSLHVIMDELFTGLIELKTVDIWDQLDLPSLSEENIIQYYNDQKRRFSNLCVYLSSMLRGYEAKNSVLPHDILEVLCRGLAITPLNLKDKTSLKEQLLYMILPKLHISLFSVLDALINGFAQELISFGTTILQLFQQTLQWTSTVLENQITFSGGKPFRNLRISTYKCLSSWLTNVGLLSGVETIANECLTFILKDITPERDCILLTVQKTQHLSKRAVKRFKNSQYENSPILNNAETSIKKVCLDADLCKEALIALQNIFLNGNIMLKQTFYRNVQNVIIPLLYCHYLGSSEQTFYRNHDKCRLEIFKLLKVLQMNPHITVTCPIQYYLEISDMALCDNNLNIIQEAKLALTELEKIIHPTAPTLQLPSQQQNNVKEFIKIMEKAVIKEEKYRI